MTPAELGLLLHRLQEALMVHEETQLANEGADTAETMAQAIYTEPLICCDLLRESARLVKGMLDADPR